MLGGRADSLRSLRERQTVGRRMDGARAVSPWQGRGFEIENYWSDRWPRVLATADVDLLLCMKTIQVSSAAVPPLPCTTSRDGRDGMEPTMNLLRTV